MHGIRRSTAILSCLILVTTVLLVSVPQAQQASPPASRLDQILQRGVLSR